MENYLIIGRDIYGNYTIRAELDGLRLDQIKYMFYSKREAVRAYRARFGLTGKHFFTIDNTREV